MLDQTFTAENFRRIYDYENRKGEDLEGRFFPALQVETATIRQNREEIKALKVSAESLDAADYASQMEALLTARTALKESKDRSIDALLDELSAEIRSTSYRLSLTAHTGPKGKTVYQIADNAKAFFINKMVQRNINRLYKVKQSDRSRIVSGVRDAINNRFPLEIVRTDIEAFYESVDRAAISRKLDEDHLLSLSSKRYIRQILSEYGRLSGRDHGIPRGVGVSAYLAELYLRTVDSGIRGIPGLVFYGRYVDDIIAIFAPPPTGRPASYLTEVAKVIQAHGLLANLQKTSHFEAPAIPARFEYLGYRFSRTKDGCRISPSASKVWKYRRRVTLSFDDYFKAQQSNPRRAHRQLIARMKFLTGNTRLSNSKSHAVTGIYYNNASANDIYIFGCLDKFLHRKLAAITSTQLRARLMPMSFSRGFNHRHFHQFTATQIGAIVKAWKHDA